MNFKSSYFLKVSNTIPLFLENFANKSSANNNKGKNADKKNADGKEEQKYR